jgi:hypothetical protein
MVNFPSLKMKINIARVDCKSIQEWGLLALVPDDSSFGLAADS